MYLSKNLFFSSKRSQIKFYALLNNDDLHQKRATTNPINHSADIDFKEFLNIYRKYTSESYSFWTIDTTLPVTNFIRFRKNLLDSL